MTREYENYVEHPRFGRSPRLTGLNPESDLTTGFLHWNATKRIPNTAVEADLSRQSPAVVAVTHYYDVRRTCRDCGRPFIFFAQEQKQMAECCLSLIEEGVFHRRQTDVAPGQVSSSAAERRAIHISWRSAP